jgi:hypothetical protein
LQYILPHKYFPLIIFDVLHCGYANRVENVFAVFKKSLYNNKIFKKKLEVANLVKFWIFYLKINQWNLIFEKIIINFNFINCKE